MDALALLCNLYGDGPATLKRLRAAGCDSFRVLEDLEPDELSEILGTNQAAARRFLREARLLVERVTEADRDPEERPPLTTPQGAPAAEGGTLSPQPAPQSASLATPKPAPALPARAPATRVAAARAASKAPADRSAVPQGAMALSRPEGEGIEDEGSGEQPGGADNDPAGSDLTPGGSAGGGDSGPEAPDRSTELIDRVLATWRERDAAVGVERDVGAELGAEEPEEPLEESTSPQLEPGGTALRARLIDGLDRDGVDGLREAGFHTLEDLADHDAMSISQAASMDLTRVMRLQFLARRLIHERGAAETESAGSAEVLKPAGKPWPLARGTELAPAQSAATLVPRPELTEVGKARNEADEDAKFSISETPYGAAKSELADELDRASQRLRRSDALGDPDEGTGGPFA